MVSHRRRAAIHWKTIVLFPLLLATCCTAIAQHRAAAAQIDSLADGLVLSDSGRRIEIRLLEEGIADVHVAPSGQVSERTAVLAPSPHLRTAQKLIRTRTSTQYVLRSARISIEIASAAPHAIRFLDAEGHELLRDPDPLQQTLKHALLLQRADQDALYGVHGIALEDATAGLQRNTGGIVSAGIQGDSGAPFLFTHRYALLVDSDGGEFAVQGSDLRFLNSSRNDLEFFVLPGQPLDTMAALSRLVGPPPLPPRWTLGFVNSQWGSTEAEVKKIIATYRERKLPLDGFIFDFDWKAWGEDNYGEWRWNSISGAGAVGPDKFPDGASGEFARWAADRGVHFGGILKPRILTTVAGSNLPTQAAAYASAHNFWYPGQTPSEDYFSHRLARDIDFSKPQARSWYWEHLIPAFDAGIVAWWNDEADTSGGVRCNNLQFLNMGRALYDGQREHSDLRVWSINRNFYLGASRYGYAGWSGDIPTGFASMALQRRRMVAALNTGEFHWSMDAGGFHGHPSNENYARWMQFAAFVPIMRVHGDLDEKRQPWVYGPVAEAAARKALDLRSTLLPYIYAYQRQDTEGNIGLVRPLGWEFPNDQRAANEDTEWMFGPALLVSPVVAEDAASQDVYLPSGQWYDYATGRRYAGGQTVHLALDNKSWSDIPLFVRAGSILATGPVRQFVDEEPLSGITLDVFPDVHPASFVVYDDDGKTYDYEKGSYLRQPVHALTRGDTTVVTVAPAEGHFAGSLRSYRLRVHRQAHQVTMNGRLLPVLAPGNETGTEGYTVSTDRFGPVVELDLRAGQSARTTIVLR